MKMRNIAALTAAITMTLCVQLLAACGDDDDDNNPSQNAGRAGAGSGGQAGSAGSTAQLGKVSGTVSYDGSERGFLDVVLFSSKDPAIFVAQGPKGLVRIDTPAFPQTFTIEDVEPGHYWIECKVNVGPEHVGPGPDDPTCFGKYDGMNWEREIEVDVVAGQTTALPAPLIAKDPAGAAGAGGGGGAGGG